MVFSAAPLTVAQTALFLGLSQSWVRRHQLDLPAVRMGGSLRFDPLLLSQHLRGKVAAGNSLKSERTPMEPNRYQRGSVFQKGKNKVWYGTYREDVVTPAGTERRQRKVRLGTVAELPTKNAATNKLAELMDIVPTTDTTFQQLATRWQKAVGPTYKVSTLEHYTNALRAYVLPTWKDRRITAITHEMIQNFLAEQAKRYSKSTLRSMRAVLGLTLGWAVRNELMRKNPCAGIKLPVGANVKRCVMRHNLTPAQIFALVDMLPEPYATLVLFIADTGVRIGEAAAIKASDFDCGCETKCEDNVVHISQRIYNGDVGDVKTQKSVRRLDVAPELKERMLRIAGSDWVFCSRAGTPIDDGNALRRYIRPACRKLNIVIGGWHDFRHTLNKKLRKAGTHPRVIADILGHSKVDLSMNVYDCADAEDIAAALNRVTLGNNPSSKPIIPLFIPKRMVSAEGIEPSTY
jgi:integrase